MGLTWLLIFVHGFLSLGTEVLYLKALDVSLGTNHLMPFVVVSTFIFSLSLGNYLGLRLQKFVAVELCMAVYNLLLASSLFILPSLLMKLPLSIYGNQILLSTAVVAIPAFGIGLSYPAILSLSKSKYLGPAVNAAGAAVGILVCEHVLFLHYGIIYSLMALALLHGTCAYILRNQKFSVVKQTSFSFNPSIICGGMATGAIQAYFLYFASLLFQPFFYTLGQVIGLMLLGLSIGAVWGKMRPQTLIGVTTKIIGGFTLSIIIQVVLTNHLPLQELSWAAWAACLSLWILPTSIPIGLLFPSILHSVARKELSSININLSVGNGIGLILFPMVSGLINVSFLPFTIVLLLTIWTFSSNHFKLHVANLVVLMLFCFGINQKNLISLSSPTQPINVTQTFLSPGEMAAIYNHEDELGIHERLYQHGFSPIDLTLGMENYIAEVGTGFVKNRDHALVIGVGSGRTAGRAAELFSSVDAVDLSLNTTPLLKFLKDKNYNAAEKSNLTLHVVDGLLAPYLFKETYDLIILTVDPGYQWQAAKLYTHEYFSELNKLLKKDGRMIFWLDHSLSPKAQQILMNTANAIWPVQTKFALFKDEAGPSYYFVVNSNSVLEYIPLDSSGELAASN